MVVAILVVDISSNKIMAEVEKVQIDLQVLEMVVTKDFIIKVNNQVAEITL